MVKPHYVPAGCNQTPAHANEAQCFAMIETNSKHEVVADTETPPSSAKTPADIQAAYHLPATGQGQTVAVVDAYGYSTAEDDLAKFRAQFGLPACTTANGCFRKTDQRGGVDYPADADDWAEETALDLDAVSSACPACHILLVEADSANGDDLGTAAAEAVTLGAKFVSNSYGVPGEDPTEAASDFYYDHPGVVVTASTGDRGNVVNWPASDPNVVAVGGTSLDQDTSTERGWTETTWDSGGSGCSLYEPKPDYQAAITTGCANRAIADISADADPDTGLAVYDSLGGEGWFQVGGTSLSSPLMAAMYALAGTPTPDTFPVTYPYLDGGASLNDVTSGSDGVCGTLLCQAGPGWDGPTGLGTPNGVNALKLGPHGTIGGQVTSTDGVAVANATVTYTNGSGAVFHTTTDAKGQYSLKVMTGTYTLTATAYGYKPGTQSDVVLADGASVTVNLTMVKVPTHRVSGRVTDASGHGWPLYAAVTVAGYPNGPIYTNPKTGEYSVDLPDQNDYQIQVNPVYPGYQNTDATVSVGADDVQQNFAVAADLSSCAAPGYAYPLQATFEGWHGTAGKDGWSVADHGTSGAAWDFDTSEQQWNLTGGSGDFAAADPFDHNGAAEDTDLLSPVFDLTPQPDAELSFDTVYLGGDNTSADVQISADGQTWTTLWHQDSATVQQHVTVPLGAAAGKSGVRLRFHFAGVGQTIWEVDNVTVGACVTAPGGLVTGEVTDANTGEPINGAVITDTGNPTVTVASTATPADPSLPDGFFWLFSPRAGAHTYTTAMPRYATTTGQAVTDADDTTAYNPTLQAGQLEVSGAVSASAAMGKKAKGSVTLTNVGREPVTVKLGEESTGFTSLTGVSATSSHGAPLLKVKGAGANALVQPNGDAGAAEDPAALPPVTTADTPWQTLPDYPEPIMDNAVAYYQGRAYSVAGVHQIVGGTPLADAYMYDPMTTSWQAIASLPAPLESPAAAFVDGVMYVVGGWSLADDDVVGQRTMYAYHPGSDTWTRMADMPEGLSTSMIAVLGSDLYVIGGCTGDCDAISPSVYRYTPATNEWTKLADYPVPIRWGACAGIDGEIVCTAGENLSPDNHNVAVSGTYIYHPDGNTWTQGAPLPYTDWGMAYNGANDKLQVIGGITDIDSSNRVSEYDPVTNTWAALPNANFPLFRTGGSQCGMFQVGGSIASGFSFPSGEEAAEQLPGFGPCGGDHVDWLSVKPGAVTIAPGKSVKVDLTLDASVVSAPGVYTASLAVNTDSPYTLKPVAVTFTVTPPASWTEVTGTVTDVSTGATLAGATVTLTGPGGQVLRTAATDAHGRYDLWLADRAAALGLSASATGHEPQSTTVHTTRGGTTVANFALTAS